MSLQTDRKVNSDYFKAPKKTNLFKKKKNNADKDGVLVHAG